MRPLPAFKKYHKGQRVFYTGRTSYNREVKNAPGTICALGNSITIELDDYIHPFVSRSDLCFTVPARQYASVSVGDLKTKTKKVVI